MKTLLAKRAFVEILLAVVNLAVPILILLFPRTTLLADCTALTSLLVKGWGMPHQIYRIVKNRSAGSVSLANSQLNYMSYALWAIYGWQS